ncbi:hypothetical protein C1645_778836 [Glomus cerebriforme]|uniref:Uncharacterized protein n=1 Tax=Glomus cerebriforme TaxID=658196 RepID=A0A397SQ69_9GLOM|nr:hypothetical protein C1645_778836 [Glomus cerebriforme]
MEQLINFLHNDLKETNCDSLVIVYYYCRNLSKFSNLKKNGIMMLTYKSVNEFKSALQKIKSPIDKERISPIKNELQIWFGQIRDSQKATRKIQGWHRRIKTVRIIKAWLHRFNAAKKIQNWLYRIYKRIKSRRPDYDPTPDKIYNDMNVFCKVIMKQIKKKSVRKYNILLRGQTVDVVVKLLKQYHQIKNLNNNCSLDANKNNSCLELENELKDRHYKKVEQALKSLSITENSAKHKETDIKWLKTELQQAEDINNQFKEWKDKYEVAMKL